MLILVIGPGRRPDVRRTRAGMASAPTLTGYFTPAGIPPRAGAGQPVAALTAGGPSGSVGGVPVAGPAGIDDERHRQCAARRAGAFHDALDERRGGGGLLLRNLKSSSSCTCSSMRARSPA